MSHVDGAQSPRGYGPVSQPTLKAPPKVDPGTIDTAKDTLNSLTSSPTLSPGGGLMKLFGNLGLSGMRIWNQVGRQEDLQTQLHETHAMDSEALMATVDGAYGATKMQDTPLMKEFDSQKNQIAKEAMSEVTKAAYDGAKDVATIGPLAKRFPFLKYAFGAYEIGAEMNKVNDARNEHLQAKGDVESFDHLMKLLDRPMNSSELETYSKLRTTMLDKEVQFNQQIFKSVGSGAKSILDMTPYGDIATMGLLVHKHTPSQSWQDNVNMMHVSLMNFE